MKLKELKPNSANPRTIKDVKFKKLCESIKDFPKMMSLRPIVIDNDGTILGGNMRYKALLSLGYKEIPDNWVKRASELTDQEKQRFIIEDNVGFGDWDFDMLANDWDFSCLQDWGLDLPNWNDDIDINPDDCSDDFSLKDGDKEPFQQMAFTLADKQAELIKSMLEKAKRTAEFNSVETFGNGNGNGNALYLIVKQWEEQKK